MQYSKYFANKMRISQGYNEGNHKRHTTSAQKDYPVDETYGAAGSGGYFIAPFDCKIVRKYDAVSNYIWLTSTGKVRTPSGDKFVSILIAHISASEFNALKVGDVFKQGEKVVSEATDANSTGHHNHVCAGFGELSGTGWAKQVVGGNEFWVLTTKEGTQKPEDVFYIDKSVTEIIDDAGINFKEMPTEEISEETTVNSYIEYTIQKGDTLSEIAQKYNTTVEELASINNIVDVNKIYTGNVIKIPQTTEYKTGIYKVLTDMYIRKTAGTNEHVLVKECTDAMKNALNSTNPNDYAVVKAGHDITALDIIYKDNGSVWIKNYSGYLCLKGVSGQTYLEFVE